MSSPTVHISLLSVTLAKHKVSTYFSFYRFWHWTFIMHTKQLNTLFHEAILPHWRYIFYPFLLVYRWPTLILLGSLGPVISDIFFTVHIKEGCRSRNQRNQSRCCISLISILALLCVWIPVKSLAMKRYNKSNVIWYFWGKTRDKRCYYK